MATRKTPAKRRSKPEQKYIEGTEPPRIKEIDVKALEYRNLRDKRQKLLADELECKGKLLELMHKHDLKIYPILDSDVEVVVEMEEENVKVRKRKAAGEEE